MRNRILYFFLAFMCISWAVIPVLILQQINLIAIFPDDAYYYFEIAFNSANGLGMTFDGFQTTNGVHYLWHVILVILASVIGDRDLFLIIIPILQSILMVGAILLTNGASSETELGNR